MHDVVLTILPLLFGAFLALVAGWIRPKFSYSIGVIGLAGSVFFTLRVLAKVVTDGTLSYSMGGWAPPWGIVFVVDALSAAMLVLIAASSLITYVVYHDEIVDHFKEKTAAFVALILLVVAGHMGIVATGDLFNLYVLIEVAALSGYALLGFSGDRSPLSSLSYLCIGSVGASFYLLGVGYLYIMTGSLNLADLSGLLEIAQVSTSLQAAVAVMMLGLWVKMALFPFHGWLPGAYSNSSFVSASFLAPMTTKVMVYVMLRLVLSLFPGNLLDTNMLPEVGLVLATAAIFFGSIMAYRQKDLRRTLCYILVAEVGYMVGGLFIGNREAMTGTILHIFADALMTLTLFVALGSILRHRAESGLSSMKGMFKSMPFTMASFVLAGMSMIGVPPLFGFFSKWRLLSGALEAGEFGFMAGLLVSSLVNVVIFFRIFETAFFESSEDKTPTGEHWARTAPLALTALLLILGGVYSGLIVETIVANVLPTDLI
ncbi:complex I subunit 5 family protein [Desulfovibrio oxyclinae]|jgi:multicomponent Na+:H+ antiporter subunit D|uniref:complex I subunit 5 family protein n=1 Tax=Desulfovibrio oxyclinae TaxID=63560 RepID=UPI0003771D2F|nr:proton-conducting transporter membrane subunit [Desulfovibrio oxyclinae]